jgi:type IV secretion system protein VirD4
MRDISVLPTTRPGIPIGFHESGEPLLYSGESHLLLVAPARSGKATDILIPILLQYGLGKLSSNPRKSEATSVICVDPKGQLAAVTGPRRARAGQRVIILNPFKILPDVLAPNTEHFKDIDPERVNFFAHFNPMASLKPEADSFHADLGNLTDALFDGVSREGWGETHWIESGQDLTSGIIGHLQANETDDLLKNLPTVRRVITSPRMLRKKSFEAQIEKGGRDESIAQILEPFIAKGADNKSEIASIISTARTQTRFLGVEAVANCLRQRDFDWPDLRKEPTTVYIVLPVKYLKSCARFFRLMLADCLHALLGQPDGLPVLCIADEFAQLGKLDIINDILGLGAGLNIQLMPVLQDLNQLKDIYKQRWESFPAAAGAQIYFAPRDYSTSEEISKLCGEMTVAVPSESSGEQRDVFGLKTGSQKGTGTSRAHRRTKTPQEIRQLKRDRSIIFSDTHPGFFFEAYRKPYWEIDGCKGLYSPDPYYVGED